MKVERVSYDVPTPGALEGMLKAVYWRPAIRYVIKKIVVYNPIRFVNVRRNEVKQKIGLAGIRQQMRGEGGFAGIYASEQRTQRAGMLLRDVKYGIEFGFELTGIRSENPDEGRDKHYNIILRRLQKGQFFHQPFLGCREFSVKSIELAEDFDPGAVSGQLKGEIDLGFMLYGMKFEDGGRPPEGASWEDAEFSDKADAVFYRPRMVDGVIDVQKYREVSKCL